MSATSKTIAVMLCAAASVAPARAQETACPVLRAAVERGVPESVGDAALMGRLLKPTVGPQLSRRFGAARVQQFAGDVLRPDATCNARRSHDRDCTWSNAEGSSLRTSLGRGRVIYTNLLRSEGLQPTKMAPAAALASAREAAGAFGLPMSEVVNLAPRVRYLEVGTRPVEGAGGESFEAEAHVWFKRSIGGVPVAYSKFHAAFDATGRLARAHVRWPDFRLEPRLSLADMHSRRAVVDNVIAALEETLECGNFADLKAEIVYLDSQEIAGADGQDAELGGPDTAPHTFLPALLVRVLPIEQKEDSGILQEPVQEIAFSLFGGKDN